MRIAVSTDGDQVSAHFGRCPGHQPGLIPQFLHEKGVECIIAGGMGMRAQGFFDELGIKAIVGISGKVDDTIDQLVKGTLKGGESLCKPGAGKGYGVEKEECDHPDEGEHEHKED